MHGLQLISLALYSVLQLNEWSRTLGGDLGLRRAVVALFACMVFRQLV